MAYAPSDRHLMTDTRHVTISTIIKNPVTANRHSSKNGPLLEQWIQSIIVQAPLILVLNVGITIMRKR
jgi:hypothetical protein